MAFSYVRRKDNPAVYLMAGYCDFSGQFDDTVYEQVTGSLPESATLETSPSPVETLEEQMAGLPAENRAAFCNTFLAVRHLLGSTPADTDAATILLEALADEPYGTLKQAVLATLS